MLKERKKECMEDLEGKLKTNSKYFWKIINENRNDSTSIKVLRNNDGVDVTDPDTKAELLNTRFQEAFNTGVYTELPEVCTKDVEGMKDIIINKTGILQLIDDLWPGQDHCCLH